MKEYNQTIKYVETTQPDIIAKYIEDLEQENKQLKEQLEEIRKVQKITFETLMQTDKELAIREKALELAVNYCQREIDGDGIGMQDIQAIYEIGTEFFINKAKESMK